MKKKTALIVLCLALFSAGYSDKYCPKDKMLFPNSQESCPNGHRSGFIVIEGTDLEKGKTLMEKCQFETAIEFFEKVKRLERVEIRPYLYIGLIYEKLGDYGNAIKAWEEGLKILDATNEKDVAKGVLIGNKVRLNDFFQKIKESPGDPLLHYDLAKFYESKNENFMAMYEYQKAINIGGAHVEAEEALKRIGMNVREISFECKYSDGDIDPSFSLTKPSIIRMIAYRKMQNGVETQDYVMITGGIKNTSGSAVRRYAIKCIFYDGKGFPIEIVTNYFGNIKPDEPKKIDIISVYNNEAKYYNLSVYKY